MDSRYDPFDPASPEARYEALGALRAEASVHQLPDGPWLLVGYDAVLDALKQVERFVGTFGDSGLGAAEDEQMIPAIREPRHGRIRRVINAVMAPHRLDGVETFTRELAEQLLASVLGTAARDGTVDLVAEYVDPIPSTVIAHVLGIPTDDAATFRRWSDELLERQGTGTQDTLAETHPEFAAYIDRQIASRRGLADPPDDVITRFLRTEIDGEQLKERAVRTQVMFLVVAGNETTRNLIGNMLHTLARDPALYQRVRDDRSLVPVVMEESLRHDSPVQVLARAATEAVEVADAAIDQGERVVLGLASANRDERHYDAPGEFRVDRGDPRDHVAFGAGPHVCPGASLARIEATVALNALCDRIAAFAPVDGYEFDANPVFWALGPRSLRVELTPA